jgi:chromosome segregation ATPase
VELANATDIANAKRQQEIRLMGLQGDKVGALAAQREQENAALDKATLTIKNNADALSDLQDAQSTLNSAASSFKSALSTAAGLYQAFVDNVASASTKLDDARAAIVDQYRSALPARCRRRAAR